MFDIPDNLSDPSGSNLADGPGCFWHLIFMCIAAIAVMVFLKWMS